MRKARRKGRGCADPDAERIAQRSGTSPNHAKIERHAGSGPANGNGSSSRPADTTAATHNFHCAGCASGEDTARASTCCIQREFIAFALGDGTGAIELALSPTTVLRMCITDVQIAPETTVSAGAETRYNRSMVLASLAIRTLVAMFLLGLAGSAVVVLISFVHDGKELFGKD